MSLTCLRRSEQLRKISVLFFILCLFQLGWSWPFHKKSETPHPTPSSPKIEKGDSAREEIITSEGTGYRKSASAKTSENKTESLEITRTEDAGSFVTRSLSVIDRAEIEKSPAMDVPDLLRSKAGIVVSKLSEGSKSVSVDIRGFGESGRQNVLVLVDGRRANQVDMSGADWAAIPLSIVERVEIIRGPSTILYGDNATGGVINIVTRKIQDGIHAKAQSEVGSNKYKRNGGTVSASNSWAHGLFHYENTQDGGWRTNSDTWANDWFGKLGLGPWKGGGIDLTAGHHRDRFGLPGALFMQQIDELGRRGSTHSHTRGWSEETFFTANPNWNFELGENGFALSGFNSFRRRQSKQSDPYPASLWGPGGDTETIHHIDTYEFQPKVQWTRQLTDWLASKMTSGFDVYFGEDKIRSGDRGTAQDVLKILKKTLGVYVFENLSGWDKLLLNLGVRGEWADYRFDQQAVVSNLDTQGMRNAAFDIGTGFRYNERSLVYFDTSRAFRFPVTEELYQNQYFNSWTGMVAGGLNQGLKQQQQMNYELGVRDHTFRPLEVGTNIFLTDIKDEIYYDPLTYLNSNYSSMTRRYGWELESALQLFEQHWYNLKPFYNLTLQKPYFKGGEYANKNIPFVPGTKFATGFVLEPVKGLTISTELNHIGSRFAISDQRNNQAKLKAFTSVDLKTKYQWKWASAWITLTNLFDANYSEYGVVNMAGTAVGYYPSRGRSLMSGFSLEY